MLERGFSGMGLRDLAAQIGLQVASLYNHIENKQELLFSILRDHMREASKGLEARLALAGSDPERKLRAFILFHITFHASRPVEAGVCISELRSLEGAHRKAILAQRDAYEARLIQILEEGVDDGVFSIADCRLATRMVLGAITAVLGWYDAKAAISAEDIADSYADMLLDGLRLRQGPKLRTPRPDGSDDDRDRRGGC